MNQHEGQLPLLPQLPLLLRLQRWLCGNRGVLERTADGTAHDQHQHQHQHLRETGMIHSWDCGLMPR